MGSAQAQVCARIWARTSRDSSLSISPESSGVSLDQTGSFLAVEYGEQIAVFESRKMHEICTIEAPVSAERFKVMRWGPDAR